MSQRTYAGDDIFAYTIEQRQDFSCSYLAIIADDDNIGESTANIKCYSHEYSLRPAAS